MNRIAVAGPTVLNSLPGDMRDPDVSEDSYRQSLKTFLFSQYQCVLDVGLQWTDGSRLSDLDYADDIVLLETSRDRMQQLTETVETE